MLLPVHGQEGSSARPLVGRSAINCVMKTLGTPNTYFLPHARVNSSNMHGVSVQYVTHLVLEIGPCSGRAYLHHAGGGDGGAGRSGKGQILERDAFFFLAMMKPPCVHSFITFCYFFAGWFGGLFSLPLPPSVSVSVSLSNFLCLCLSPSLPLPCVQTTTSSASTTRWWSTPGRTAGPAA